MPYTTEEGGRLNNFAVEPKVYEAKPPSPSQQRNYIIMGVVSALLIGGLLTVAIYASSNVGVS
ncbi:MAG: ssl1498 family light-harvesting-like protein [Crocosphaera sp.]|nr:ssl1498 family light-harvesting-like protein [Crocosphaera sp.]